MRSTLLRLVLGAGLAVAAFASAAACTYQETTASDQAAPAQTAQTQPGGQNQSN